MVPSKSHTICQSIIAVTLKMSALSALSQGVEQGLCQLASTQRGWACGR
jgi:hypothetical protein